MAFKIPNFYAQNKKGAFAKGPEASTVPSPLNISTDEAYDAQSDEKKSKQSRGDFKTAADKYNMDNYGTKNPSKGIDDDFKSKAKTKKLKSEKEEYKKKREVTAAEKAKKASTKPAEEKKVSTSNKAKIIEKNADKVDKIKTRGDKKVDRIKARQEKRKNRKADRAENKEARVAGRAVRKEARQDKRAKVKEAKSGSPAKMTSPLNKDKTKYTLHGKPLTEAQTGYDPKQLISDQSEAADKKARIKYDAEQAKERKAKANKRSTPAEAKAKRKAKEARLQAVKDARKASDKERGIKKNPSADEMIAARNKRIAEQKAKKNK